MATCTHHIIGILENLIAQGRPQCARHLLESIARRHGAAKARALQAAVQRRINERLTGPQVTSAPSPLRPTCSGAWSGCPFFNPTARTHRFLDILGIARVSSGDHAFPLDRPAASRPVGAANVSSHPRGMDRPPRAARRAAPAGNPSWLSRPELPAGTENQLRLDFGQDPRPEKILLARLRGGQASCLAHLGGAAAATAAQDRPPLPEDRPPSALVRETPVSTPGAAKPAVSASGDRQQGAPLDQETAVAQELAAAIDHWFKPASKSAPDIKPQPPRIKDILRAYALPRDMGSAPEIQTGPATDHGRAKPDAKPASQARQVDAPTPSDSRSEASQSLPVAGEAPFFHPGGKVSAKPSEIPAPGVHDPQGMQKKSALGKAAGIVPKPLPEDRSGLRPALTAPLGGADEIPGDAAAGDSVRAGQVQSVGKMAADVAQSPDLPPFQIGLAQGLGARAVDAVPFPGAGEGPGAGAAVQGLGGAADLKGLIPGEVADLAGDGAKSSEIPPIQAGLAQGLGARAGDKAPFQGTGPGDAPAAKGLSGTADQAVRFAEPPRAPGLPPGQDAGLQAMPAEVPTARTVQDAATMPGPSGFAAAAKTTEAVAGAGLAGAGPEGAAIAPAKAGQAPAEPSGDGRGVRDAEPLTDKADVPAARGPVAEPDAGAMDSEEPLAQAEAKAEAVSESAAPPAGDDGASQPPVGADKGPAASGDAAAAQDQAAQTQPAAGEAAPGAGSQPGGGGAPAAAAGAPGGAGDDDAAGAAKDDEAGAQAGAAPAGPLADAAQSSAVQFDETPFSLPNISLFVQMTYLYFISKLVLLPMNFALPVPGIQFNDAFKPKELVVPPNSPLNLFREVTLLKYHVNTAKVIGKGFADYIKGICDAICKAITMWTTLAMFTGVKINGPVGMLTPGGLFGPPLMPLILMNAPMDTIMQARYSLAIASAVGTAWQSWQSGLTGVLTYPAFAAFPGPMAPPMPAIPMPLAALTSPGEAQFAPNTLKGVMMANFGDPTAAHSAVLFESIANAFFNVFQMYKAMTMILLVLGMGPIPTFLPPVVPVGPVVGGNSLPLPGAMLTIPLGKIPGPTGDYNINLTPFQA